MSRRREQAFRCLGIVKKYLANCSIHGVKYLVLEDYIWIERIFWLVSCVLSWWGCSLIILSSIKPFIENPVEVTAETTYIDWETPFPAIAFCVKSSNFLKKNYFKQPPGAFEISLTKGKNNVTAVELLVAYKTLEIPCSDLLATCRWNNVEFPCCEEFQPLLKTGVGHCYIMNSVHASRLRFFVNRTVEYGDLEIDIRMTNEKILVSAMLAIYVLNNLQLPIIASLADNSAAIVRKGYVTRIDFTITDIYNEQDVRSFSIEQRKCQFYEEAIKNSMFNFYTSDSCAIEVYIQEMIRHCGCVHFYYTALANVRTCNMTEQRCLFENRRKIKSRQLFRAKCYPNCEGTTLDIQNQEPLESNSVSKELSRVHFMLRSHPTKRYRRYVVHSVLDVVVAVGSALGLFMGASILSFFEIPYWLLIRRDHAT